MFGDTGRTQYDLNFKVWGIPVRIHPLFWLIGFLFSPYLQSNISDLRQTCLNMLIWILAWTLTFLVHEFGHALVIKYRYGANPWIVLYGMGGAAIHQPYYRRQPRELGHIFISLAGPFSQIVSALLLIGIFGLWGGGFVLNFTYFGFLPVPLLLPNLPNITHWSFAVQNVFEYIFSFVFLYAYISVFWGILNLVPIYPLDGGQVVRNLAIRWNPWKGVYYSLWISIFCAVFIGIGCLMQKSFFGAVFFGFFAMINYQEVSGANRRHW